MLYGGEVVLGQTEQAFPTRHMDCKATYQRRVREMHGQGLELLSIEGQHRAPQNKLAKHRIRYQDYRGLRFRPSRASELLGIWAPKVLFCGVVVLPK